MNLLLFRSRVLSLLLVLAVIVTGINIPVNVFASEDDEITVSDNSANIVGASDTGITNCNVWNPSKSSVLLNHTTTTISYVRHSGTAADKSTSYSYGLSGTDSDSSATK